MQKIIDFHNHIFPDDVAIKATDFLKEHYKMPVERKGTIEDLQKSAKEAGIYKIVVHSTATKVSQVCAINDYISNVIKQNEFFFGFGSLHPEMDDIKKEVLRIKGLGLCGIKLHPDFQGFKIDSEKAFKMLDKIDCDLPILLHSGDENIDNSSPLRISRAVEKFKDHTFIVAHLGGYKMWDMAIECLYGKNIYIDTSSSLWVLQPELSTKYIKMHGVDKVLFGTDYPMTSHKNELERFYKLNLNKDEQNKILYENARKLLKINF